MRFLTSKPARLALIVLLTGALFSCGQKGPLQRPDQSNLSVIAATNSVS